MKKIFFPLPLLLLTACGPKINHSPFGSNQDTSSIVGGQVVSDEVFAKHVVAIYNEDLKYWCTGTLINRNEVLTAAHCLNMGGPRSYTVYFSKQPRASIGVLRRVTAVKFNSHYNPDAFKDRNDIALLRFRGDLPAGFAAMPLPKAGDITGMGRSFYATGYGTITARKDITNKESGLLRYTTQKLMLSDLTLQDSDFLVNQSNGHGICFGDSGGPAFVKMGGQRILIGVASAVYATDRTAKARPDFDVCRHKAIYISVFHYLAWIKNASAEISRKGIGNYSL
jgi:secreted trypsin-like serine protease